MWTAHRICNVLHISQPFCVEKPIASIAHVRFEILLPHKMFSYDDGSVCNRISNSFHRFWFRFKSDDWLGHFNMHFLFIQNIFSLMCFGSLSCWNINTCFIFRFLSIISHCISPFILHIICSLQVLFAEKQLTTWCFCVQTSLLEWCFDVTYSAIPPVCNMYQRVQMLSSFASH